MSESSPQSLNKPDQNNLSVATSKNCPKPFYSLPFEEAAQEAKDILISIIAEIDQELESLNKMRKELDAAGKTGSDGEAEEYDCEEEEYYPQSQRGDGQISRLYDLFADRPDKTAKHAQYYND